MSGLKVAISAVNWFRAFLAAQAVGILIAFVAVFSAFPRDSPFFPMAVSSLCVVMFSWTLCSLAWEKMVSLAKNGP